jgi:N-sulfoglucosamine sulfohydrolase
VANVLMLTADDMGYDAMGLAGNNYPKVTPNIDGFSNQSYAFTDGHSTISSCQQARSVWLTGLYPQNNGVRGFEPVKDNVVTLVEVLKKNGISTGIMGKNGHVAPPAKFPWDYYIEGKSLGWGEFNNRPAHPEDLYYKYALEFFVKPTQFFLMCNSYWPHKNWVHNDFPLDQIKVPPYLPNLLHIQQQLANYYLACTVCDDIVGAVLQALKDSGKWDDTFIIFLGDNAVPLPFCKGNCYPHSTRVPFVFHWENKIETKINKVDMVSGIDVMPTILDVMELPQNNTDGTSFLPLLKGVKQEGRDSVHTQYWRTIHNVRYRIHSIITKDFCFIYNFDFQDTYPAFSADSYISMPSKLEERLFHRPKEEFYDLRVDPYAKNNLIETYDEKEVSIFREKLRSVMRKHKDPLIKIF